MAPFALPLPTSAETAAETHHDHRPPRACNASLPPSTAASPAWAASRAQSRVKAVAYRQAYEAAEKTHLRQASRDFGSGNTIVTMTGAALRNQARHLDRNHDIISGGLSTLVQNIIGPLTALEARNARIRDVFAAFADVPGVHDLEASCLANPRLSVEHAQAQLLQRLPGGGGRTIGRHTTQRREPSPPCP
ncbi:MAG TPA: hypothetical protein ACQGQJ_07960 [Xylella fastidiosa subsp. multiplex]